MEFDRRLEYQFGLIYPQTLSEADRAVVLGFADLFAAPVEGSSINIRFDEPTEEEALTRNGIQFVQVPTVTWHGSGVWRLVWSPIRLDVYVNARAFEDVAGRRLTLEDAARRVLPGVIAASEHLPGVSAQRTLVVVTGEASRFDADVPPAVGVARRYLSQEKIAAAETGELPDVSVRADWETRWTLGAARDVSIHRIEHLGTATIFAGQERRVTVRAQWDANTSPLGPVLSRDAFEPFAEQAVAWIGSRMGLL